jgi:HlyD family secretion protein
MDTTDAGGPLEAREQAPRGNPGTPDVSQTVHELEAQLVRRRRLRILRIFITILVVAGLGAGLWAYRRAKAPPPQPRFVTAVTETRDVLEEVQSTGVVEPLHSVEVGAQVSGRVVRVLVDFNDRVKQGQLLAEIDPEIFGADVVQTRAQLASSEASVGRARAAREAARVRLSRLKLLVAERAASAAELDQAQADLDMAEAEVGAAEAQRSQVQARLRSAATTLKYTKIHSPIDGVVIDRRVEPGQTVASSFSTPVLFEIARDLTRMRVIAEVDEADVGKVKEGMGATVVVDAFPSEQFEGTVTQIRLSPNNVEGVVTYGAVILVANPDGMLRPGMTATATVTTARADGVLAVKNAALRFEPLARDAEGESDESGQPPPGAEPLPRPEPGTARVYQIASGPPEDPTLKNHLIQVGITDGVWTEVKAGLSVGEKVVVDEKPVQTRKGFRLF